MATWKSWLPQSLVIVAVTLWIYWPALRGGLIWDDQWYITLNPLLQNPAGLWKFWFQPGSWVEYYPLQETVLWVQWQLFGNNTLGYHLANLALHLIDAFLVWKLLGKFGLRFAWLGGLLFAIHPVQVDSVAYICELKNTLSLLFFLLAMNTWIDYEAGQSQVDYKNALGFFLLALLCKITVAPFAALILLYAWWKRGRIAWPDVKACAPFLLAAVVLGLVSVWAGSVYQKTGHYGAPSSPLDGLMSRVDAIGLTASIYFSRAFLPVDVMLVYPQWPLHPFSPLHALPWLTLVAVLIVLWKKRRGWGRHALLGLGFFFILLSPVLGFIFISYMNVTWAMDHMLYLPIVGIIGLVVAGMEGLGAQLNALSRRAGAILLVGVVVLAASVSRSFAGHFVDEETYWTRILDHNPNVWLARTNLAQKYTELERYPDALAQEDDALALRPRSSDDYYMRGLILEKLGRPQDALADYQTSLAIRPDNPKAYLNLGEMARHAGDLPKAEEFLRTGLKFAPDDTSLGTDLAGILVQTNRTPEAIEVYKHVADVDPSLPQVQYNLGDALLQTGDFAAAADHLTAAVALDPKIAAAHGNLGAALAQLGRTADAIDQFQQALRLDPNLVAVRNNLALALVQTGHIPEAIDQFKQVLQIDPANAKAQDSLAKLEQYEAQHNAAH